MSVIEKGLKKAGLKMQGDTLPKEQRTVKAFQRLIAAMRAAESEVQDQLTEAQQQLNEQLILNGEMRDHIRHLENELVRHRLKEGLCQIESLTVNDRSKLLELSMPATAGSSSTN